MKIIFSNISVLIVIIFGATNLSLFALFISFDVIQAIINLSLSAFSFILIYLFTNSKI